MLGGKAARSRLAARCDIWFWKMTPPMTTDIAVARLRVKPKVAVAAAMSRGRIWVWRAMRGAWKLGPVPMPAMIWKMMIRGQEGVEGRLIYSPKPSVMKKVPNQIMGLYRPVLRMKMPAKADMKDRESTKGNR